MEIVTYKGRPFSVFVDGFLSHFALLSAEKNRFWKTQDTGYRFSDAKV